MKLLASRRALPRRDRSGERKRKISRGAYGALPWRGNLATRRELMAAGERITAAAAWKRDSRWRPIGFDTKLIK
jgi:hypothetical protein